MMGHDNNFNWQPHLAEEIWRSVWNVRIMMADDDASGEGENSSVKNNPRGASPRRRQPVRIGRVGNIMMGYDDDDEHPSDMVGDAAVGCAEREMMKMGKNNQIGGSVLGGVPADMSEM